LLLLTCRFASFASRSATPPAAPPARFAFRARLLLLLRRLLGAALFALRPLLRAGRVRMRRGLPAAAAAVASATLLLLRARVGARRSAAAAALIGALPAGALLELLEFALHETPRLSVVPVADGVVSAVGAAFPAFGIRFLTGRAKNALG
jgi:hypothetical protein